MKNSTVGTAAQVIAEVSEKVAAAPKVKLFDKVMAIVIAAEFLTAEQKEKLTALLTPLKATKVKGEKKEKGTGIIGTIAKLITDAGEEGISKTNILKGLMVAFPEADMFSLTSTVRVQVPTRINKEKFLVKHLENGNYVKSGELEVQPEKKAKKVAKKADGDKK
jgi:hypothetical protein